MCISIPRWRKAEASMPGGEKLRKHSHSLSSNGAMFRHIFGTTALISPTITTQNNTMALYPGFSPQIERIYRELCGGKSTLSRQKFIVFVEETQGEIWVEPREPRDSYTLQQFCAHWSYEYGLNPLKPIDPTQKDLSKPISHYFISSSHNTYLLGNQITSDSSAETYMRALSQDCRCIEIDVWNGVPASSGFRSSSRSRSPKPEHKRNFSASSVATAVEERFEAIKQIISGKSPHSRNPSVSRNTLDVPLPSPRPSLTAVESIAVADDERDQLENSQARSRSHSRSSAPEGETPNPVPSAAPVSPAAAVVEPVVMHAHTYGQRDWTLNKPVGFREVCRAIRRTAFLRNHLPVIVSLEVHADTSQQDVMVDIMKEEWGEHLLSEAFINCDPRMRVPRLDELKDKILIKVKKASATANQNGTAHSLGIPLAALLRDERSSSDDETTSSKKPNISKKLSSLAVYTHSKHFAGFNDRVAKSPSHIFSLSESNIKKWHRDDPAGMMAHNRSFLMRAYPDPVTRVDSRNMDPTSCWRKGVQMVALNWQTLDTPMMLNHAMFADEIGWALKPPALRLAPDAEGAGAVATQTLALLRITIIAGQSIPPIKDKTPANFDPAVRLDLHIEGRADPVKLSVPQCDKTVDPDWTGVKEACVMFPTISNVAEEFSFLKIRVEDDGTLSSWNCFRLDRLQTGYRFVELLGDRGQMTAGRLLVKIEKKMLPA